jgi:hypothetical protein
LTGAYRCIGEAIPRPSSARRPGFPLPNWSYPGTERELSGNCMRKDLRIPLLIRV